MIFLKTVYTIGYGGWSLTELLEVLIKLGVKAVVDVRRWNSSRRNPEFSGSSLKTVLEEAGLMYYWLPELGGYRKFGIDVEDRGVGKCFESEGFRAYATYITTSPTPKQSLQALIDISFKYTAALLCCERLPWMCHRKILSDYLVSKGFKVIHVLGRDKLIAHTLSKCASIEKGELVYVW